MKFLTEHQHKRNLERDARALRMLARELPWRAGVLESRPAADGSEFREMSIPHGGSPRLGRVATIISAPSSTKNKDGKRDPEMHQTAKGKQWYFGMKAHVGVDSRHKLIHTVLVSAANVADCLALPHLLHGKETCVWGDQAYQGHSDLIRSKARRARDCTNRRYRWRARIDEAVKAKNRNKSRVRAKVEHSIGVDLTRFGTHPRV